MNQGNGDLSTIAADFATFDDNPLQLPPGHFDAPSIKIVHLAPRRKSLISNVEVISILNLLPYIPSFSPRSISLN